MGTVMVGCTEGNSPRLRRAPHEFPLCGKDTMFSYAFTECVCGIPETRARDEQL